MLPSVKFAHVEELCGKRNFKRRRQLTPYTFFYLQDVPEVYWETRSNMFCGCMCVEEI